MVIVECSGHGPSAPVGGGKDVHGARPRVKRRALTTARREQNRLAQSAYRKRQKEQRQKHKEQQQPSGIRPLRPAVRQPESVLLDVTNRSQESKECSGSPAEGHSQDGPALVNQQHPKNMLGQAKEFENEVKNLNSPLSLSEDPSISTNSSNREPESDELALLDVYRNVLQFVPTTIFSAILHNALSLGFDLQKLADCGPDYISPFYQSNVSSNFDPAALFRSSAASLASSSNGSIPPHLYPTLAQILIPHHASLDLIPLPFLREGAIMLSAAMPQTFNLWELKLDIYERGGLIIWRKSQARTWRRDNGSKNSYHPWEMKSWEAAPWFLAKWCLAIGAEDSEFHLQSIGWQVIRELISSQGRVSLLEETMPQ